MSSRTLVQPPRMLLWLAFTAIAFAAALVLQNAYPGSLLAVTAYKAHLMSLGGWGGYWLDRACFPYARPHALKWEVEEELQAFADATAPKDAPDEAAVAVGGATIGWSFEQSMLRRAVVIGACLVCVGLGA